MANATKRPTISEEQVVNLIGDVFEAGQKPERGAATAMIKQYIETGGDLKVHIPEYKNGGQGEGVYDSKMAIPHVLAYYAAPKTMESFISKGGDINMQNSQGQTAAHILLTSGIYTGAAKIEDIKVMTEQLSHTSLEMRDGEGLNFIEAGYARLVFGDKAQNGVNIVLAIENADKDDPNFFRFKPVQEALIKEFGREKIMEMAQNGIDASKRVRQKERLGDDDVPRSRFETSSAANEFKALASNLRDKGLKTTEIALSVPFAGNDPSRGLA